MMKGAHRGGEGRDEDGSPARGGKAGKGMFKRWKRSSSKSIDILNSEPGSEDFEANDDNADRERVGEDSLADFGNRMNDSATSLPEGQDWMRATSLQFSIRSSLNSQHPPSAAAVEADNNTVEGGSIEELYSSQPTLETTPEDLETPIPDPKKCVQEALLMSSGSSSEEISPVCVDQFPTVHNNINNSRPDENSSPEGAVNGSDNDNEDGEEDDTPPQSGNNKRASISTYFDPTVGVMPLPFSDMDDLDDSSPESTRFMDFYRDQPPPDYAHHRVHRQRPPRPEPNNNRRPTAFEREQSRRQFQATQQARNHNDNPIKEQQQQQMQTQQPIITAEVTVAGQAPAPPSPTQNKDTTPTIPSNAEQTSSSDNSRPTAAASPPQSPPGTNPRNNDKKSRGYNRYGMAGLLEKHKHKHIRRASEPAAKQTTSPSPSPNKGRRNSLAAAVQQGIMNQIRGGGGNTRQQHNHHHQVRRNSANQAVQDDPAMDHSDPRAHMTTTKTTTATKVESSSSERESASSSSSSYELVRDHSSTSDLGCSSQQQVSQELHASDSSSLYHDGRSPSTRNISVDNTIDNDAKPTMPARRTESEGSEETVQTCPSRSSYSYVKGLPFTKDPSSSSLQQEPPQQQLPPQHPQPQPPYTREPADHYVRRDPAVLTYGTPYTSRGPRVMPTPSTVSMASEETEITAPSRTHAFRLHEEASNSRTSHSPPQSDFNGTVVIPGSRTTSGRIPATHQHYTGAAANSNNSALGNPVLPPTAVTQVNYLQQHPRTSPPLPAPTTTTTSAAPPPPVVANSHRLPDSMPPQRQRSNLMQRPPPQQVPGPDETIFIHVKPDLKVPLRRVPDVCQALAKNYYDTPNCPSCNQQIAVVADAAFIYCPRCHEINPVFGNIWPVGDFPEEPEYHRFGLGLGMTWDTMKKVFQELFPEEYANDHHQHHPTATSTSS